MDIGKFMTTRALLSIQVATVAVGLDIAVNDIQLEVLDLRLPPIGRSDSTKEKLDSLQSFVDGLEQVQRRNAFLATRAVLLATETVQALKEAADVIAVRQATLEQYLHEVGAAGLPSANTPTDLDLIPKAIANEALLMALEHALTVLAAAIGGPVLLPVVLPVAIIRIGLDVHKQKVLAARHRESVIALTTPNRRNDSDAMFDLQSQLQDQDQTTQQLYVVLKQLPSDFLTPPSSIFT